MTKFGFNFRRNARLLVASTAALVGLCTHNWPDTTVYAKKVSNSPSKECNRLIKRYKVLTNQLISIKKIKQD